MILLFGAGGHACVVLDSLRDAGVEVRGFFDDAQKQSPIFGSKFIGKYDRALFPGDQLIISIGNNATRKKVAPQISHPFATATAKSALLSPSVGVGHGSMILHRVIIQAYSEIGKHVILNTGSQVDHNCVIGDYVHIAPGVVLCGEVKIGEGTLVGAGAVILPGITVGKWCTIGAGAVVINHVPDGSVYVGNPAHEVKRSQA